MKPIVTLLAFTIIWQGTLSDPEHCMYSNAVCRVVKNEQGVFAEYCIGTDASGQQAWMTCRDIDAAQAYKQALEKLLEVKAK